MGNEGCFESGCHRGCPPAGTPSWLGRRIAWLSVFGRCSSRTLGQSTEFCFARAESQEVVLQDQLQQLIPTHGELSNLGNCHSILESTPFQMEMLLTWLSDPVGFLETCLLSLVHRLSNYTLRCYPPSPKPKGRSVAVGLYIAIATV